MKALNNVFRGLILGFVMGLVYAWSDTLAFYTLTREVMKLTFRPFTAATVHYALLMVALCTLLGAILGAVAGRVFERRPTWFVHAMTLSLCIVALIVFPQWDRMLVMSLISVGMAEGLGYVLFRFGPSHRILTGLAVPVLMLVWYGVLSRGMPPEVEHKADPARLRPPEGAPNILWVVFDTTRADRMSTYGHHRETSPNVDALAREGAVFDRAFASSSWTVPSHASMFTGLYSSQTGCHSEHRYLDPTFATLAEHLYNAGYNTALFTGNPWLDDFTGLSRGFSTVHPSWRTYLLGSTLLVGRAEIMFLHGGADKGALETREAFRRWFEDAMSDTRPFFAFVNYMEPHNPYHLLPRAARDRFLPEGKTGQDAEEVSLEYEHRIMFATDFRPTPEERELVTAVYDGAIHYIDHRFGELVETVREAGKLDDTLVIVASDHGEMFGKNDIFSHEIHLYEPLVRVPLVMRWPGHIPGGVRIDSPVELLDLYPTVLEYVGLEEKLTPHVRGRSLTALFKGGGDPERPVFAETYAPGIRPTRQAVRKLGYDPATWRLKSVQVRELSLIRYPGKVDRLFDLSTDPDQGTDIKEERPEEAQRLGALLDQFVRDNPRQGEPMAAPEQEMDPATRAQLEALGYIEKSD